MKKFLIIFVASVFFIALVIGTCNGEDYDDEYMEDEATEIIATDDDASLQTEETVNPVPDPEPEPTPEPAPADTFDSSALEMPRLIASMPEQILYRTGYTTSYNNKTKNANWVAWHLTKDHTSGPWSRDGIPYMVDTDVKGARQELDDWFNHGLPIDHGHMCPAGDNKWSEDAMVQTFYLTNMCPQNSSLNRGDWEELESRCRGWANHYGEVYIACGPIFYSENYVTIGYNNVGVPDAFFKVVLRMGKKPQALGFIYPNDGTHHKMNYYVLSVDEVEEKTGIDFFCNLPDDVEDLVESVSNFNKW